MNMMMDKAMIHTTTGFQTAVLGFQGNPQFKTSFWNNFAYVLVMHLKAPYKRKWNFKLLVVVQNNSRLSISDIPSLQKDDVYNCMFLNFLDHFSGRCHSNVNNY